MRYLSLFLIFYVVLVEAKSAKTDHAEIVIIGEKNIIDKPGVLE
jgi:hypothetical protein